MNNDFDDLDELERELGDTVRVALRRVARTVADDRRPMGTGHRSPTGEAFLTIDLENTTKRRPSRNGVHLIAAGILAAAAVTGIAVAVTRDGDTTPSDAPIQTVAEAPAPPPPMQLTELVLAGLDPVEVTLSLPEGWEGDEFLAVTEMGGRDVTIWVWDVTHVYSDPCQWQGTLQEVGPTVEDLAVALEQQPMRDATVSDIEVDGFDGKLVRMSVPDDIDFADCDNSQFMSWNNPAGNNRRNHQYPGQRDDNYIFDVNGTRIVINVAYTPGLPQADLDEIESIMQSMRIRSPEASETPPTTG